MRFRAFFAVFLCLGCLPPIAHAQEAIGLADAVFPQASDWPDIESLSALSAAELGELGNMLSGTVRDAAMFPDASCDFGGNAIAANPQAFRWIDVNGDGQMDVLYSGPAQCAEGNTSIAWVFSGQDVITMPAQAAPAEVVRIRPTQTNPEVISFEAGCCGQAYSVLRRASLGLPQQGEAVSLAQGTQAPDVGEIVEQREFTAQNYVITHPVPDEASEATRRYKPGASGFVLAERPGFLFVRIFEASNSLLEDDPIGPVVGDFAGWIAAE